MKEHRLHLPDITVRNNFFIQEFTASGTFYRPLKYKSTWAVVLIVGAGGGGAKTSSLSYSAKGGTSGAWVECLLLLTSDSYTVTLGAGGAGQTGITGAGGAGGSSSFGSGITVTGGTGGTYNANTGAGGKISSHANCPNAIYPINSPVFRGMNGGSDIAYMYKNLDPLFSASATQVHHIKVCASTFLKGGANYSKGTTANNVIYGGYPSIMGNGGNGANGANGGNGAYGAGGGGSMGTGYSGGAGGGGYCAVGYWI
jgi:hypothetical protein